ncbi:MAG: DUF3866 family protein [Armatimonadota bacterium]
MLNKHQGKVLTIKSGNSNPGIQEITVDIDGTSTRAVNYPDITGLVHEGDEVLLNTTAVDLRLGTGGVHFVICNLSNPSQNSPDEKGHIIKLRYTPMQCSVLSAEEEDSPLRDSIQEFESLDGMPVVCCELHSQIAHSAAAIKSAKGDDTKVAYIMTDGAALPVSFSRLVWNLKKASLIDTVITCGQAFGGDIEAVNIYSALITAKQAVHADAVIVCQGPGNAGTGTEYGFSGIQQGEALNAAGILGGTPIGIVRMSFADPRERHQGISHHSMTVFSTIALFDITIALPILLQDKSEIVNRQLDHILQSREHKIITVDGNPGVLELANRGVSVSTMGRSVDEDLEFFLSASAAGIVASTLIKA